MLWFYFRFPFHFLRPLTCFRGSYVPLLRKHIYNLTVLIYAMFFSWVGATRPGFIPLQTISAVAIALGKQGFHREDLGTLLASFVLCTVSSPLSAAHKGTSFQHTGRLRKQNTENLRRNCVTPHFSCVCPIPGNPRTCSQLSAVTTFAYRLGLHTIAENWLANR